MKYLQIVLGVIGVCFLIAIPYMLAFWGYNFLAGIFTILPKVTFWQFFLGVMAIYFIRNLFKRSKSEK
jgi:hypothetical protein